MTRGLLAASLCALLLGAAGLASTQKAPTVSLVSRPSGLVAGRPWNAVLVVRGARPLRVPLTAVSGRRRAAFSARRWRNGRYRARLVFPAAGRWVLTARIGRRSWRLGAVRVRAPAPLPLLLTYPTEVVMDSQGDLLVVESGQSRIARIDPATGRDVVVARIGRPFGVVQTPSGAIYTTDANRVLRVESGGRTTTITEAESDVGPLAVDGAGNVYFTTATRVFRVEGGTGPVTHLAGTGVAGDGGDGGPALAAQLRAPHGLVVGADGALYVSDTGNNRVRRIDLASRVITAVADVEEPAGLSVGPGGAIYIAQVTRNRVSRIGSNGTLAVVAGTGVRGTSGDGGPATAARLDQPVDVVATSDGTVFILQSGVTGRIRRVDPSGRIGTLTRR